jgi:hypothetical protein
MSVGQSDASMKLDARNSDAREQDGNDEGVFLLEGT